MKFLDFIFTFLVLFIFGCLLLLFFSGCGRKQKNVFNFSNEKAIKKINKLELNFVRNIEVQRTNKGNLISWDILDDEKYINLKSELDKKVLGYRVYRLVKSLIISKKPLNKKIIKTNSFLDEKVLKEKFNYNKDSFCYIVRAVYKIQNQIVEGPTSQISCS